MRNQRFSFNSGDLRIEPYSWFVISSCATMGNRSCEEAKAAAIRGRFWSRYLRFVWNRIKIIRNVRYIWLHFEVHQVLCLPRNLHFEFPQLLRLPRYLHLNRSRNLHFQVHKVLAAPTTKYINEPYIQKSSFITPVTKSEFLKNPHHIQ